MAGHPDALAEHELTTSHANARVEQMNRLPLNPDALVGVLTEVVEQVEVIWERSRAASPAPLSASQLRALFVLDGTDGINLRDLAAALDSSPPSTSRLCDRLQAVGFLERATSATSRREVQLRLTTRGRAYLADLRDRRRAHLRELLDALPSATRAQLTDGLAQLRDVAARHNEPPRRPGEPEAGSDTRSA